MMAKLTAEEFEQAAFWLRSYESDSDDSLIETFEKVASFLEKKAKEKRMNDAVTRIVEQTGASRTKARQALKKGVRK